MIHESASGRYRIAHPENLFIGGTWVAPSTDKKLTVISPATEEMVAQVPAACEADIDCAVAAARRAFDEGPWPRMSPADRGAKIATLARLLGERANELAFAWSVEGGGPIAFTTPASQLASHLAAYYGRLAATHPFEEVRPSYAGSAVVIREPVGVVAAILPWNAPVPLTAAKLAPALAAGCTIIVKVAPETPLHAYIFAECVEAAGFPDGVVNFVAADREASDRLVRDPRIDKISFTGSTATGKHIAGICAERLARYSLELGGKSAAIILDDIDVADAIPTLAAQATTHSGQICFALTRLLVPRKLQDTYTDALVDAFRSVRIGDPLDPATGMGPLAMKRQLDRVEGYVAKGRAEGAKLATGGARPKDCNRGYFFEPTLFVGVGNGMTIAREEIFGPVLSLIPYDSIDEAVAIANDSPYGLHGGVFTRDSKRAYAIARRVRTGNVGQNGTPVDLTAAPFGGFKQSGIGREGGPEGLNAFVELKTVYLGEAPTS